MLSIVVFWFVLELCVVDMEMFVSVFMSVVSVLDGACSSVCLSVGFNFALTSFFLRFGAVLKATIGLSGKFLSMLGLLG